MVTCRRCGKRFKRKNWDDLCGACWDGIRYIDWPPMAQTYVVSNQIAVSIIGKDYEGGDEDFNELHFLYGKKLDDS